MKNLLTLTAILFTAVCGCHAQENVYLGNYEKAYLHTKKGKETSVKQRMAFDKELAGQFGEYMAKAGRLLDAEKYGEAIELYSRIITDGRDTVVFGEIGNKAVECLAWAYLKSGQRDKCKAMLRYENKLPYQLSWLYPTPKPTSTQIELIQWDAYDDLLARIRKEHKHPAVYDREYVSERLAAGIVDGKRQYRYEDRYENRPTSFAKIDRYPAEKRVEAAILLCYFRYGDKSPANDYLKSDAPEVKAAIYCADYVNNRYGYQRTGFQGLNDDKTKAQAARLRLEAMGMFDARKIFTAYPDIRPLICYDWAAKIVENKETADYPLAAAYLETCIGACPEMASDNAVLTTQARLLLAQGYYKDALNTLVRIDGNVDEDILAARQGHLAKLREWGVSEAEAELDKGSRSWRIYYNWMDREKRMSDARARMQRQQQEEQNYREEAENYDRYVADAREFENNGDLYNADLSAAKALYVEETPEMYNIRIRYVLEGKMKISELSENDQWNYKGGYDAELEQARRLCNASLTLDRSAANRAYWYKGLCCGLLGYNNEAIASYSTYLTEYPQAAAIYYNRGLCYYENKNTGAALADFKKAREFFNDTKYKDRCLRMIDKCVK